ncbi:MAG: 50S ribosomal protein L10 [Armatimonadetes bacterium]|nr:50S ribosomal protein L10 [Armatimonadota bacterium]
MPTAQKANVIEQTKQKYDKAAGVLFAEYRGLKVHQLQDLRKQLKAKGGEFSVVKNTLFKIAAGDDAGNMPEAMTSGPTGIAFIYENEAECAKVLADFAKTNKALVIKGGYISGAVYDDKQVDALAKLPPREVLIAQVIGAVAAPLSSLVGTIEAIYAQPIRTVYAVVDKLGDGSAAPAKEEASAPAGEAETTETETASAAPEAAAEGSETPAEAPAEAPTMEADAPSEPAAEGEAEA